MNNDDIGDTIQNQENNQDEYNPFEEKKEQNVEIIIDKYIKNKLDINEIDQEQILQIQREMMENENPNIINKIGQALLIKAFFPTGNHIKQAISYMDVAIKVELFIYNLISFIFWISLLDFGIFIYSIFLFFTSPIDMGQIWFHFFHLVRGIIGIILLKKLPNSHQLIQNVSIPQQDEMTLEIILKYVIRGAKDSLKLFTQQTKKLLFLYFLTTIMSFVIDLILFVFSIKDFGDYNTYTDFSLLFFSSIYLFLDLFYLLWLLSFNYKLPQYLRSAVISSFIGFAGSLSHTVTQHIEKKQILYKKQSSSDLMNYNYISNQE